MYPAAARDGVGGVAMGAGEIVSANTMIGLGVTDDRFDRRAAAESALDGLGEAASLAGDVDLELVIGRSVVAAIAAVGDDAGKACADLRLDLRDHGRVETGGVTPCSRLDRPQGSRAAARPR